MKSISSPTFIPPKTQAEPQTEPQAAAPPAASPPDPARTSPSQNQQASTSRREGSKRSTLGHFAKLYARRLIEPQGGLLQRLEPQQPPSPPADRGGVKRGHGQAHLDVNPRAPQAQKTGPQGFAAMSDAAPFFDDMNEDVFPEFSPLAQDQYSIPQGDEHRITPAEMALDDIHSVGSEAPDAMLQALGLDQLSEQGYTQKQVARIKPKNRSVVIRHHQALIDGGLTRDQIVEVSGRAQVLDFFADGPKRTGLFSKLPSLVGKDFLAIAKGESGHLTLEALLTRADGLKRDPLRLNDQQLFKLAKGARLGGGHLALEAVWSVGQQLRRPPYSLTSDQVVSIASNKGGSRALQAVRNHLSSGDSSLTVKQVVSIASNIGGSEALQAVRAYLSSGDSSLTVKQVVSIASHDGGSGALEAVLA